MECMISCDPEVQKPHLCSLGGELPSNCRALFFQGSFFIANVTIFQPERGSQARGKIRGTIRPTEFTEGGEGLDVPGRSKEDKEERGKKGRHDFLSEQVRDIAWYRYSSVGEVLKGMRLVPKLISRNPMCSTRHIVCRVKVRRSSESSG